jgi:hypothetical protein
LCLGLASLQSEELATAIFYRAHDLDATGTGVMMVIEETDDGSWRSRRAGCADVPHPSTEDVADLLGAAPLESITPHDVDLALRNAIDSASYWQSPDGDDLLAAHPEMRPGLLRVAESLLDRHEVSWWGADRMTDQWCLQCEGATSSADEWRPLPDPSQDLHAILRDDLNHSGAWWSIPPVPWTIGRLPEGAAFMEDSGGATQIAHPVQDPGRTLEIRGPEDWVDLCRRFPVDVTKSRKANWKATTGRKGRWVVPDWSRVANVYDAVHLTVFGYLTTAGRVLPVDERAATVMAGSTADGTWWLNRVPVPTGGPTTTIVYDDEGDRWVAEH